MLVIRDKLTKEILFSDPEVLDSSIQPSEFFPAFDSVKMEVGYSKSRILPDHFKIIKNKIEPLTLEEKIDQGLVAITSSQKVVRGKLELKPVKEQVGENIIEIPPHKKLVKNEIVDKTPAELCEDGLIKLNDLKAIVLNEFSMLSFEQRTELIPDYKLQNASLGVYDEQRMESFRKTIEAFRTEFKRLESKVKAAKNAKEIEKIKPNYPRKLS